ncbi:exodeoxyribonuclease VII small subunit [Lachnospiraceae bacterium LCP25S3_G4]
MEEKKLEEVFAELEVLMHHLEEDQVSLEEAFQYYHDGMAMLKTCSEKIDTIEKQVMLLDENGECHEF